MHAYCNYNGIGIIPWGPLATGDLARPLGVETERANASKGTIFERKFSPSDELIVMRVEELARKYDMRCLSELKRGDDPELMQRLFYRNPQWYSPQEEEPPGNRPWTPVPQEYHDVSVTRGASLSMI